MSDCSLYLVSPPQIKLSSFIAEAKAAFAHPLVRAFQLRLKDAEDTQILEAAAELLPLARERDIAFILNDNAELAVRAGADGVHVGQEDMAVDEIRKIIGPERVIGVSCHASRDMAMNAGEAGADYVAFGAFYPTTSKPQEKVERWGVPTPDILTWCSTFTTIPCVAIGGVKPENCKALADAGADFIAAITSVWNHPQGAGAGVEAFAKALA